MNKRYHITLLTLCLLSIISFAKITNNELLGSWKYKITDVPPEYEIGVMSFEQRDDKTVGFIGDVSESKMQMKELVVKENNVTFKLTIESSEIVVNLVKTGDKMSGKVITGDGEFPIKAEKQVKK